MLIGRGAERERIERLLSDARRGQSAALVVRGEAGIGKTTLLRYAVDLAEAMTVVTATGIESESEVEFSGLLELCRPLVDLLAEVPERQGAALRAVLGLGPTEERDRFAVGAALLGLLAAAGEANPVLVVVDDAQWLDHASADAVRFASRRLHADRVCFLFAVRDLEPSGADWLGFDDVRLGGLALDDARTLIARSVGAHVADDVAGRLHAATGGSPLALLELPRLLQPEQLDGRIPIADPLPAGERVQRAFVSQADQLPDDARLAVLVVAAATTRDLGPIAAALAILDLSSATLQPAEDMGLLTIVDGKVRFRHPLIRSAVHEVSPPSARRSAHAALAAAYEELGDADRSARHLAVATVGPDETAAATVAAAAGRALERAAFAAASDAFQSSAALTPPGRERAERLAEAAEAAWSAGATARSMSLAESAGANADDPQLRARLLHLRGRIELQAGAQNRAREQFLEAATLFGGHDPPRAVAAIRLAVWTCHFEGKIDLSLQLARRIRELTPVDGSTADLQAGYVLGRSLLLAGDSDEGVLVLQRTVQGLLEEGHASRSNLAQAASGLAVLERHRESRELVGVVTQLAREEGPMALAYALSQSGHIRGRGADWQRGMADAQEGVVLARALEQANLMADCLACLARIEARRGDENSCRSHAEQAFAVFDKAGMALSNVQLRCALGLLELGLDRLEDAVATLEEAASVVEAMGLVEREVAPVPDLVEALVRLGRLDEARSRLEPWAGRAPIARSLWGQPLALRCRGLLSSEENFDECFLRALQLHGEWDEPFALARTLLCYGERLRRAGRRRDARERLREAHTRFEELEARPWEERARRELRASGERLRRAHAVLGDELTPQEQQVAFQAAEGKSNKEVAAALFLSPKTVEFHLSRVYRKLDLSSRAELIHRFAVAEPVALV